MKEKTKGWVELAKRDLYASKKSKDDKFITNISCFHAQQAIEKILKAMLEEKDLPVPKIHDLIKLYKIVQDSFNIKLNEENLQKISVVYVETRYPSDIGLLPSGFPSVEEANEIYNLAEGIFEDVIKFLKKK